MGERAINDNAAPTMLVQLTVPELEAMVERAVKRALEADPDNKRNLTHNEAAEWLGIKPNALHKRVQAGYIVPDKRPGRDGVRSNEFSMATLREYSKRK